MGIFKVFASILTGDSSSICFLPTRLSGCVTTIRTSCFLASASKIGTAKFGVPINIIFISPPN